MEEHTNYPFRLQMKRHGAALVCTERVDAVDVAARDRRALRLLYTNSAESPRVGQISGADPATMAEAARVVEEQGFDAVDLNFECPIRRLVSRGEGGAALGRSAGNRAHHRGCRRRGEHSDDAQDSQRPGCRE
ncbi:MAG: tRNA-dihydrouridine synthase [Pirellulales bacterium]